MVYSPPRRASCPSRSRSLVCKIPITLLGLSETNTIGYIAVLPTSHGIKAVQPDFLYSVSRDFMRTCPTPMLVLPDDIPSHPLQTSIDVASLAPNSDITVFPWREPEELRQRMIQKVRSFLKAHVPMKAAAQ